MKNIFIGGKKKNHINYPHLVWQWGADLYTENLSYSSDFISEVSCAVMWTAWNLLLIIET